MLLLSVLHTLSLCSTQSVLTSSVNAEPPRLPPSRVRVGGPVVSFETVYYTYEKMSISGHSQKNVIKQRIPMILTGVLPNVGTDVMISFKLGAIVVGSGVSGSAVVGSNVVTSGVVGAVVMISGTDDGWGVGEFVSGGSGMHMLFTKQVAPLNSATQQAASESNSSLPLPTIPESLVQMPSSAL